MKDSVRSGSMPLAVLAAGLLAGFSSLVLGSREGTAVASHVSIVELSCDTSPEFVRIRNSGPSAVPLDGFRLQSDAGQDYSLWDFVFISGQGITLEFQSGSGNPDIVPHVYKLSGSEMFRDGDPTDFARLLRPDGSVQQVFCGTEPDPPNPGETQWPTATSTNAPLPYGDESQLSAIQNAGTSMTDIAIDYFSANGTPFPAARATASDVAPGQNQVLSTEGNVGLVRRGHSSLYGLTASEGYGLPFSLEPIASLAITQIELPRYGGGSLPGSYSATTLAAQGAAKLAMPILLAELGPLRWNSRIIVRNVGSEVGCLRTSYYVSRSLTDLPVGQEIVDSPTGQPECPAGRRLAPGAQLTLGGGRGANVLYPRALLNTQSGGTIEVLNANGNNDIVATVDLFRSDGNRLLGSYNAVAVGADGAEDSDIGREVVVPLAIKWISGWYSIIGVQNLGPTTADINIRYIGTTDTGTPVDVTVTLPGIESVGFHSSYDSSTALPINFVGYALVTSKEPIAAILVRAKQTWYQTGVNEPTYTAVNGVPRSNGETEWHAPLIYRRADRVSAASIGRNSWIQVQVADGGSADVTIRMVGVQEPGCSAGPFETTTTVAGSKVFYMNADTDNGFPEGESPACFVGAAKVTGTEPLIVIANISSDSDPTGDLEALYNAVPRSRSIARPPTPKPPPGLTVNVLVAPSTLELTVGETLDAVVSMETSGECTFHVYEATLSQTGEDAPIFEHAQPPGPIIGPGPDPPFTYSLVAAAPGTVRLHAQLYGERYCGYYTWAYYGGSSPEITVLAGGD